MEQENKKIVRVALAGNPNVGKSTLFNTLTGMNQHTGNWPGKTVGSAVGRFSYKDTDFVITDLPGTYSLISTSTDEEIARDFICSDERDVTVAVADACCLERNLALVLQIRSITPNMILCVNLLDEARKKKITVDLKKLSDTIGIPVVGTAARSKYGLMNCANVFIRLKHKMKLYLRLTHATKSYSKQVPRILSKKLRKFTENALPKNPRTLICATAA